MLSVLVTVKKSIAASHRHQETVLIRAAQLDSVRPMPSPRCWENPANMTSTLMLLDAVAKVLKRLKVPG